MLLEDFLCMVQSMYTEMLLSPSWIFLWIRYLVLALPSPALTVTLIRLIWAGNWWEHLNLLRSITSQLALKDPPWLHPAPDHSRASPHASVVFPAAVLRHPCWVFGGVFVFSVHHHWIISARYQQCLQIISSSSSCHCLGILPSVIFLSLITRPCVSTALYVFPFCTLRHSRWITTLPASSIISSWTTFVI